MTRETIIGRFLGAAQARPGSPAVLGDDGPVGYAELARSAGGVLALLSEVGVRRGDRVGLITRHGADDVAAVLGTLGAGAVYVPFDPSYPLDRLAYMAEAAAVTAIVLADDGDGADAVAQEVLAERIEASRSVRILRRSDASPAEFVPAAARDLDEPAYLLFTSGSTGVPKGVAQTERNLLRCADNQITSLGITHDDRLSLLASFCFDASLPDLFPALLSGAAVVPTDVRTRGLDDAVSSLIRHGVTVYHSTPTVYRYLLEALGPDGRLPRIRTVLLGGEPVTRADLLRGRHRFAEGCVFINGYGSTEATFSCQYQVATDALDAEPEGPLPIGTPLPGYELVLLDDGEISVRSPHVAPGYWRDADRSAERFTVDGSGARSYRTGDLGRRLPDGRFVCLGRTDRQLKIRGFRVEPGEIESCLTSTPGISRAVVVGQGERLVAYVQRSRNSGTPEPQALRTALADVLPDYLVPAAIVVLDELPLTPSGKIDVLALPAARLTSAATFTEPRTPAEETVHDAWCEVLDVSAVGLDATFFDAGGHSLLLGRLRQRLETAFDRPVSLVDLLERPTIGDQASYLAGSDQPAPAADPAARDRASTGDEIAVVGMAGRFPGAADVDEFWRNLCDGVDAIHDYTEDELRALGIGPALLADPAHIKAGGRLAGVEDFDAGLFGLTDDEAARTDPQHRLFLECAWRALEDAGCDPDRFDGPIGVFASASINRYFLFHLLGNPALGTVDPDHWEGRIVPNQLGDHLPGQVAYRLGLTGPAVNVQTACSSSLVAVCQAAQSLLDYRCDVALAGGASVTWPRYRHSPGSLASPDGRCRAFDADAAGSGFSSGAGVVALKRLADAQADGDHVYAVLLGWAVTNDGAARAGFAVPGVEGQAAAIAESLACAEVAPEEIGFVEAHGSGTPIGDAIEVTALRRVFGDAEGACALGSVKTNIGHLDAASGIAGLIKAVLAVSHGVIPANLHFDAPNPEIDLESGPFRIPAKTTAWTAERRIAGVSAIGLGGTNAHVTVGEAPDDGNVEPSVIAGSRHPEPAATNRPNPPATAAGASTDASVEPPTNSGPWRLALSAHTPDALRDTAARLRTHLAANPHLSLADVEHTLATGRRLLAHRTVIECSDLAGALAALDPGRLPGYPYPGLDSEPGFDLGPATARDAGPELVAAPAPWPAETSGRRVRLPGYAFQRRRHWIDLFQGGIR